MQTYKHTWQTPLGWTLLLTGIAVGLFIPPTHITIMITWGVFTAAITILTAVYYGVTLNGNFFTNITVQQLLIIIGEVLLLLLSQYRMGWLIVTGEVVLGIIVIAYAYRTLLMAVSKPDGNTALMYTIPLIIFVFGMGIHPGLPDYLVAIQYATFILTICALIAVRFKYIKRSSMTH